MKWIITHFCSSVILIPVNHPSDSVFEFCHIEVYQKPKSEVLKFQISQNLGKMHIV